MLRSLSRIKNISSQKSKSQKILFHINHDLMKDVLIILPKKMNEKCEHQKRSSITDSSLPQRVTFLHNEAPLYKRVRSYYQLTCQYLLFS